MGVSNHERSFRGIAPASEGRGAPGEAEMERCSDRFTYYAVVPTFFALLLASPAFGTSIPQDGDAVKGLGHPGCDRIDAKACVQQAIDAMGGEQRLAAIHGVSYDVIGHTVLSEQSYRQQPFITSYERDKVVVDFDKRRIVRDVHMTWPESDPHQADLDITLITTTQGGVYHSKQGDSPCSLADLDNANDTLALGPERLLLNAAAAGDLRYVPSQWLRATPHSVVEFTWQGVPVKVLLNAYNHLPDAMERTRTFKDWWYAWGDVNQRIYFDNWRVVQGVVYPTNSIDQRNGVWYASTQVLDPAFNVAIDDKKFAMDPAVAAKSAQSKGWNREFSDKKRVDLAPGIELYEGSWNTTIIKQDDGVLVIEAPISTSYVKGILAKVRSEYPDVPIKGVLSTSDSWPHMAGVREAVAEGVPVYVLDLNKPLLDRLVNAPHRLQPDALQTDPKSPHWVMVGDRLEIGHGANRVELYPLRGASTERQYMVYFPEQKVLYASDTLVLNDDKTLYDPDLMYEVVQAAAREHLQVNTVYAMHQGPTPWADVQHLVDQAMKPTESGKSAS
jgi:glyoxylase-like metal-dependent hydrolase (beta-lactamase superfamily II)